MDNTIATPEVEVKTPETVPAVETKEVAPPEVSKQETIGEVFATKKEDTVPLASFLEIKKENKAIAKQMQELKKSIEEGATKKEVSTDIKTLAEKHDIDADFLQEFAQAVKAGTEQDIEERISSITKPQKEKELAEKIDTAFNSHFSKAMEGMTEYEGIINKEVIKSLSLIPSNANKTFVQLIEETYGQSVPGKKSFDGASARAGKNDSLDVDIARMKTDTPYFQEIMANPTLKAKYNSSLISNLSRNL